ncbi:MAG TPA: hypothetical protein PK637_13405 [Flavobacteriales bacterium]|nr:hypothetical protein [Flavobacteriales bacterium]HRJ39389.1 hypothetical protein [Flavobacteriales bacterium]
MEIDAEIEGDATPEEIKIRKTALEKELKKRDKKWLQETKSTFGLSGGKKEYDPKQEIKFIKRFLEFRDRLLKKQDIKPFIDDLQNAIASKKIRKYSPYAQQIVKIQKHVIYFYNQTTSISRMVLGEEWLKELYGVIINYENRENKKNDDKKIESKELSGIYHEEKESTQGEIVPSIELAKKEFSCLGFTGKWLELMGDPCAGFTAMVFGKPKMGKSYLAVDFAGYLAKNFGMVLYVAKEEKFGVTFAKKLEEKNATHENLIISESIPEDLSSYDFIFLDSTNSLNLSPEDLRSLKEKNPEKSFVYVFQTTKTGNFRGANTFQHDVDIVIEIPERGKAVQFGRFNQGGEMSIFEDDTRSETKLEGVSGKKKDAYPAWTRPKYMDERDHKQLRHIYDLYKQKKFKQAMDYASFNCDTAIREEIPGEIWKKMGGELTPSGEARLKAKQKVKKSKEKPVKEIQKKKPFVFHGGVRTMKDVLERSWDLELTDSQYIEILEIAQERNGVFVEMMDNLNHEFNKFFISMKKAMAEWEAKNGKLSSRNREKFQPELFANRSDDENPTYIFGSTNNRVLVDAMKGEFDLIYMVRRELANRGLDSDGKWVGFDKAREIHQVDELNNLVKKHN